MSTTDDIKADLQQARSEIKRVFTQAVGASGDGRARLEQQIASARAKRDALLAKLHQDIDARMRSLEDERVKLTQQVPKEVGAARQQTDERLLDVEKKIEVAHNEFVAHADATVGELDDEVHLLESQAKDSSAAAALRAKRDRLFEKTRALHDAAGDRFQKAKAEYEREVAYLTERRNEGTAGIN